MNFNSSAILCAHRDNMIKEICQTHEPKELCGFYPQKDFRRTWQWFEVNERPIKTHQTGKAIHMKASSGIHGNVL
jgi:hypothetical protein